MNTVQVKVRKLHPNAVIPEYATSGSAGLDLVAVSEKKIFEACGPYIEYSTELAFEIPVGYAGLVFPRSGIIPKTSLILSNGVGLVDSDFRGAIRARFRDFNLGRGTKAYKIGDRICQLLIIPYPQIKLIEVSELDETERGTGGFGSSGD